MPEFPRLFVGGEGILVSFCGQSAPFLIRSGKITHLEMSRGACFSQTVALLYRDLQSIVDGFDQLAGQRRGT